MRYNHPIFSAIVIATTILIQHEAISRPARSQSVPLQTGIEIREDPRAKTFGFDVADYSEIAKTFFQSLVQSQRFPLDGSKVLALGPVSTQQCPYRIDIRTLQEELQTVLHQSGKLQFTFAIDAMKDESAPMARYKIMQLQWEKESSIDSEDIVTFGRLASVDYLLFGRISAYTTVQNNHQEITYICNWKLGECEKGLLEWTDQKKITKAGPAPLWPIWIDAPKVDDSVYTYALGQASDQPSPEAARKAAQEDAVDRILSSIHSNLPKGLGLRGVEILPDSIHITEGSNGYDAFLQVSFPLSAKAKLLESVDLGELLNASWAKAQSAFHQGNFTEAQQILVSILDAYPSALGATFSIEEIRMMMGDAHRAQKNPLEARKWYSDLAMGTQDPDWQEAVQQRLAQLPEAPRFWPMRDRFKGRRLGLVCWIREGEIARRSADLTSALARDCREANLEYVDLSSDLSMQSVLDSIDLLDVTDMLRAAANRQAGVVLIVLLDIDLEKKRSDALIDTRVRFRVLDTTSGEIIYMNDGIKEKSTSTLPARATTILIRNYLVPHCPAVNIQ